MAASQSITGRAGNAQIASTTINITKWDATIERALADATDSGDFDSVTGQTYQSQAEGVVGINGTLEGNYDLAGSTDSLITQKFLTDGPYSLLLGITSAVKWASFNADFENATFSLSVPGATMVTFRTSFKSNGKPTLY